MKTEYEVKTAPRSTAMPRYYVKYDSELRYTVIEPVKTVIDVQNNSETYKGAVTCYDISKSVIFRRLKGRDVLLELLGAKTE
jgi:hypothetical protein